MDNSCPQCGSKAYKRNGYTRHGKQNHRCLDCGRQFSLQSFPFAIISYPTDALEIKDEVLCQTSSNR